MKMEKVFYNSAIKNETLQYSDLSPTEFFAMDESIAFRCNLITERKVLMDHIKDCDVIYCEPPFPLGIKTFDKRAKESTSSYSDFAKAFSIALNSCQQPKYIILNKRLLGFLNPPDEICRVILNNKKEMLGVWGGKMPRQLLRHHLTSNLDVCSWLGFKHRKMGDFVCGYGVPLFSFLKSRNGNSFVASDYDPHCITVIKDKLLGKI